ncbi:hypothetical protein MKK75_30035 [Methylobacterium sp. J-030]|uniref:hypothetical protein n=1 Tax=Methylobacterium sp. J-030 TaxID=2836627 RepID=UPI001FB8DA5D|nr:hypothetical protein [Methylobacterium sp. J-030]MCJ2072985.1 hypothetical protein [Methylobacterium sp. J-030]
MSLLKTLLGAVTLSAALLTILSFAVGPDRPDPHVEPPGLTAADVLASDGMGPRPERIVVGGTEDALPAG